MTYEPFRPSKNLAIIGMASDVDGATYDRGEVLLGAGQTCTLFFRPSQVCMIHDFHIPACASKKLSFTSIKNGVGETLTNSISVEVLGGERGRHVREAIFGGIMLCPGVPLAITVTNTRKRKPVNLSFVLIAEIAP